MEGIMRTGRPILFSVLLALGAAGAVLTTPAIATASTKAPAAHVQAANTTVGPDVYVHA
jgi:hypothetical protein